jgi:hypothetical protein
MAASRYGQLKALMPKVWLQQHLQKKATTSVVQEHQSPFSVAWEEQRESKLSLIEDFFLLKRGLKNAENLAKYIQKW